MRMYFSYAMRLDSQENVLTLTLERRSLKTSPKWQRDLMRRLRKSVLNVGLMRSLFYSLHTIDVCGRSNVSSLRRKVRTLSCMSVTSVMKWLQRKCTRAHANRRNHSTMTTSLHTFLPTMTLRLLLVWKQMTSCLSTNMLGTKKGSLTLSSAHEIRTFELHRVCITDGHAGSKKPLVLL